MSCDPQASPSQGAALVSTHRDRPLRDVRVLAIEQFGAGPWGTLQLADLGAEVIKIEDPRAGGDVGRYVPPFTDGDSSLFFETFNRGKRSIALDLRAPRGRRAFEDLARESDAVFSNLRGDQPEKLKIRYGDLALVNKRIVCISLSGFGMTGPRASSGAYDVTVQALAGWMTLTGGPQEPPTKSGPSLVDYSAGYVAALATVAAVWQARRDGLGRDVDLSLFETALGLLTYMATWSASRDWVPRRLEHSAHQSIVPFQAFRASDGWIVVACAKDSLWRRLCDALGEPMLAEDKRFVTFEARHEHRVALTDALGRSFAARPVAEWVTELTRHGVPVAAVNNLEQALSDEQVAARGGLFAYDHPTLGHVRQPASALGRDLTGDALTRAPFLDEDAPDLLSRVCGYDPALIEGVRAETRARAGRPSSQARG